MGRIRNALGRAAPPRPTLAPPSTPLKTAAIVGAVVVGLSVAKRVTFCGVVNQPKTYIDETGKKVPIPPSFHVDKFGEMVPKDKLPDVTMADFKNPHLGDPYSWRPDDDLTKSKPPFMQPPCSVAMPWSPKQDFTCDDWKVGFDTSMPDISSIASVASLVASVLPAIKMDTCVAGGEKVAAAPHGSNEVFAILSDNSIKLRSGCKTP